MQRRLFVDVTPGAWEGCTVAGGRAGREGRSRVGLQTPAEDQVGSILQSPSKEPCKYTSASPARGLGRKEHILHLCFPTCPIAPWLVNCLTLRLVPERLEGSCSHLPSPGAGKTGAAEVRGSPFTSMRSSSLQHWLE